MLRAALVFFVERQNKIGLSAMTCSTAMPSPPLNRGLACEVGREDCLIFPVEIARQAVDDGFLRTEGEQEAVEHRHGAERDDA